jgi:hypothetical protein
MQLRLRSAALCGALTFLLAGLSDALTFRTNDDFLIFSSPSTGTIHSSRLLTASEHSRNAKMESKRVVGIESVKEPRGVAVDSLRKILYVVDGNSKLYAARIFHSNDGSIGCEQPVLVASGLSSHWVAVDFRGKVFFVSNNQVYSMLASFVIAKLADTSILASGVTKNDTAVSTKSKNHQMVYDGTIKGVSMPRGLAVDGYRMFWANGENGKADGTLVQGLEIPMGGTKVNSLAANLPMAHGVCLTASRVFYTDDETNVFSTKVNGGAVQTVTDKMQKPRGCAFDGDGTVFVADAGDDKIVSFAGGASELGPRRLTLALGNVKAPFGLAILHGSSGASRSAAVFLAIVASLVSLFL